MTDWDAYYMTKPTDLSALYPCTNEIQRALDDRAMERKVTWIARIITGLIVIVLALVTYTLYPELIWFLKQYW